MSEKLIELPEGWMWVSIEEFARVCTGATPLRSKATYYENGTVPWITSGLLNDSFITKFEEKITELAVQETNAKVFPKHTLLIAMYGEGKTRGKVSELLIDAATNQACAGIILEGIASEIRAYLKLFLEKNYDDIRRLSSGGVQPNLNLGIVKATKIPIAPLNEQKRIVTKIEELNDRTQKAKEALEAIPQLCDRFRQSVLADAFRGDLTADWREQNPDVEPAMMRWNIQALAIENEELPQIPSTWIYRKLSEISERVSVGHVGKTSEFYCDSSIGVPFLRSQNVRPGKLDITGIQYITKEFHEQLKKSQLFPGDLLIVRVGANRGDTCILPKGLNSVNCANIVFARPYKGISDYLNIYFQSKFCQQTLENLTTGSAQGVINTKAVAEVPIPIPPEDEQQEIIRRVQSLLEIANNVEEQYRKIQYQLDNLNQSVLTKAFRGELVPQDPDDEPASILLERIRAERQKLNNSKPESKQTSDRKSKTPEGQVSIPGLE